jgi:membrane protease YdiL (CAAX protease family)
MKASAFGSSKAIGGVISAHIKVASWPLIASIGAIVISPLLVLATAQGAFYNLWLAVMMIALSAAQRLTKREIGIAVGDATSYIIALVYAVGIIGFVVLGAWAAQLIDLKDFSATTVFRRLSLNFLVTFLLALITEEGFFRGALWASCARAGFTPAKTVLWTSLAFGLWHFAVPVIDPDFAQPLIKVPQYVVGSTAFGVAMGLLRLRSGSIIVPSLCHALWNASDYTFFGAGEKIGQLGISDPTIWDPERGYAGLVLAILGAVLLWRWVKPA